MNAFSGRIGAVVLAVVAVAMAPASAPGHTGQEGLVQDHTGQEHTGQEGVAGRLLDDDHRVVLVRTHDIGREVFQWQVESIGGFEVTTLEVSIRHPDGRVAASYTLLHSFFVEPMEVFAHAFDFEPDGAGEPVFADPAMLSASLQIEPPVTHADADLVAAVAAETNGVSLAVRNGWAELRVRPDGCVVLTVARGPGCYQIVVCGAGVEQAIICGGPPPEAPPGGAELHDLRRAE